MNKNLELARLYLQNNPKRLQLDGQWILKEANSNI